MKKSLRCMALLFLICVSFGCNHGSDDTNNSELVVKFVDNGIVYPESISTTVVISSKLIEYEESQSDTIIEEWSEGIETSDFDSVKQVVSDYNLVQMEDIILAEGQEPCSGWKGMTISITETDNEASNTHSFEIMGSVCERDKWPAGVRALVDLKDELVDKYQ